MIRGMVERLKRRGMTRSLIASLALGVFVGLFFGERTSILKPVGATYVGLIQMTILPYIMVSLIRGVGSLSMREARQMLGWGGAALAMLWAVSLIVIFIFAQAFPAREGGSFFDPSIVSADVGSMLDAAVPSNVFQAMAENRIPVVVLFCLLVGGALVGMRNKDNMLGLLGVAAEALGRVNGFLVRFTALAVFSMTAVAAGSLTPQEFGQVGGYVIIATAASLVLFFGVLPALIVALTPFGYREVMRVVKDGAIAAFATGKLIVALPILIEQTGALLKERYPEDTDPDEAAEVLYPLGYSFPHAGKLLALLFVPFVAWFVGRPLDWLDYPEMFAAGVAGSFGGPLIALPFLLDRAHLPGDSIELFLVSGIYLGRLSDAVAALHLVAFTLLCASAFKGRIAARRRQLLLGLGAAGGAAVLMALGCSVLLRNDLTIPEDNLAILLRMERLESEVVVSVFKDGEEAPNPAPLHKGETRLDRVERRGVIRVGYREGTRPWAFVNPAGELVGFDIESKSSPRSWTPTISTSR